MGAADRLSRRLVGDKSAYICATLMPRTGVYDVFTRTWIPELLAKAEAPALPEGLTAGTIVGTVQPGPLRSAGAATANTLVVVAGHDDPIASNAIMRLEPRARIDLISAPPMPFSRKRRRQQPGQQRQASISPCPCVAARAFLSLVPSNSACPCARPLAMIFTSRSSSRRPAFPARREVAPTIAQALADTSEHRNRRVIEAVSVEARDFFRAMKRVGIADGPIYATGGGRSRALMELRASLFGEVITAIHEPGLTALGAALFAMETATGRLPDAMSSRATETIEPRRDWMDAYAAWA